MIVDHLLMFTKDAGQTLTAAAASYDFEGAIRLRDRIAELKKLRGDKSER